MALLAVKGNVTPMMRAFLVDWIFGAHLGLRFQSSTVFAAVKIVDMFVVVVVAVLF